MLGTAGALGSEMFILTGLAAEVAGPATVLAVLVGGFLSFSIAINYCELATIYPETGGAMTYVRQAWGKGLLAYLTGSLDSISSTFYCSLSAVGFAYSLSVFFPSIPLTAVAVIVIILFMILNILGVTKVGNIQIIMGVALIFAFAVFITAGFVSPNGFHFTTLFPNGRIFNTTGFVNNAGVLLKTIALIYAAYVGFEVIADDAEEIKNPNKNIPLAILVSLGLITLIYTLTVMVTLGSVPWQTIAGSKTALSDAVGKFMPNVGITLIALAGIVGSLTSVNSSMLSATRETFTLGRDGAWPTALSRLNRFRIPHISILVIGGLSIFITVNGTVDFLSYITSAGYLFVLFFSNLAMIKLRQKYSYIRRPFKAPFFPLTPILASLTCLVVIFYSDLEAILFLGVVIGIFIVYYYAKSGIQMWREAHKRDLSPGRWRIVIPLTHQKGMDGLVKVGSLLAAAEKELNMCLLNVIPSPVNMDLVNTEQYTERIRTRRRETLEKFIHYAVDINVPMYIKMITDATLVEGVIHEIRNDNNVKLLLMNWPPKNRAEAAYWKSLKRLAEETKVNLAVLRDRGIKGFQNILVPVGTGLNSRLAIHLANDISMQEGSHVNYIRVFPPKTNNEDEEDMISFLQEILLTQLGSIPFNSTLQIIHSDSIQDAVIEECKSNEYELIIIGSAYELTDDMLFGSICNEIVNLAPCSTLVVRRHESATAAWLHHQVTRMRRD